LLVFLLKMPVFGQSISGNTSVIAGQEVVYTFQGCSSLSGNISWEVSGGEIVEYRTQYPNQRSVVVKFNNSGSRYITAYYPNSSCGSGQVALNVNVTLNAYFCSEPSSGGRCEQYFQWSVCNFPVSSCGYEWSWSSYNNGAWEGGSSTHGWSNCNRTGTVCVRDACNPNNVYCKTYN